MKQILILFLFIFNIGYSQCDDCPVLNTANITDTHIEFHSTCPIEITNLDWNNPLFDNITALLSFFIEENGLYYLILNPKEGYFNINEEFWFEMNNMICVYGVLSTPKPNPILLEEETYNIYTIDGKFIINEYKNYIYNLPKSIYILQNQRNTIKITN